MNRILGIVGLPILLAACTGNGEAPDSNDHSAHAVQPIEGELTEAQRAYA